MHVHFTSPSSIYILRFHVFLTSFNLSETKHPKGQYHAWDSHVIHEDPHRCMRNDSCLSQSSEAYSKCKYQENPQHKHCPCHRFFRQNMYTIYGYSRHNQKCRYKCWYACKEKLMSYDCEHINIPKKSIRDISCLIHLINKCCTRYTFSRI